MSVMCGSKCGGVSCGIYGMCMKHVRSLCVWHLCCLSVWCVKCMCHVSVLAAYVGILCFLRVVFTCGISGMCLCDMCLMCVSVA